MRNPRVAKLRALKREPESSSSYYTQNAFTPDGKWIVFRSNMYGPTQVYEVEMAKHTSQAVPDCFTRPFFLQVGASSLKNSFAFGPRGVYKRVLDFAANGSPRNYN